MEKYLVLLIFISFNLLSTWVGALIYKDLKYVITKSAYVSAVCRRTYIIGRKRSRDITDIVRNCR